MSHPLFDLMARLEQAHIHFTLGRYRDDTVLVTLTLVGERVEIDVFADGQMQVSRFKGPEDIVGDWGLVEQIIEQNR